MIAAIATAPGEAAISVVRISGAGSLALLDQITKPMAGRAPFSTLPAGTFRLARIFHPESKELLDEALILVFRAPHSYTGEDAVEIQGHGGFQAARRVLDAVFAAGATPAPPGDFTKRAFLNGKLDMLQAEAVLDLIHARGERSARLAAGQLSGKLGSRIATLCDDLLAIAADVEAMLDFPDDELPPTLPETVAGQLAQASAQIQQLLATWQEGRILRDGIKIVIAGPPNAGKSTLLNKLAGYERAIVSPTPGTTRDALEELVSIGGIPVSLLDTAGIHATDDPIEQEGIRRALAAQDQADWVIVVLDASTAQPFPELAEMPAGKSLILLNKADLGCQLTPADFPAHACLTVSLLDADAPARIAEKITQCVLGGKAAGAMAFTGGESGEMAISSRHKTLLSAAQRELTEAAAQLASGSEAAFVTAAEHIRAAATPIGNILGRDMDEATLDAIFSRFCVGK